MKKKPLPPPKDYDQFTWVGTVGGVHGIRGEIKIFPITKTPEYYLGVTQFFLEWDGQLKACPVERIRLHKGAWVTQLKAVTDRNEAETLRNTRVFLEDQDLRPLEEDEFFWHQIVGCDVVDMEGQALGTVVNIMETGASDVYIVSDGQKEVMVPSSPNILKKVDIENKRIHIDPIPGLFDGDDAE